MAKQVPQVYGSAGAPKMVDGTAIPGQKFKGNPGGMMQTAGLTGSQVTGYNTVQQKAVQIVSTGKG